MRILLSRLTILKRSIGCLEQYAQLGICSKSLIFSDAKEAGIKCADIPLDETGSLCTDLGRSVTRGFENSNYIMRSSFLFSRYSPFL